VLRRKLFVESMDVHGMLVCLFCELVSSQMVSLAVSDGSGGMSVGRKVVKFRGSIVHALWHRYLLTGRCSDRNTIWFSQIFPVIVQLPEGMPLVLDSSGLRMHFDISTSLRKMVYRRTLYNAATVQDCSLLEN
jgi:hypothetical protein